MGETKDYLPTTGATGKLEWSVKKRHLSLAITTDEKGHLFHCASYGGNRYVEMYTADGTDRGILHMEKEEFPGPWRTRLVQKIFVFGNGPQERWAVVHQCCRSEIPGVTTF